LRSSAVWHKPLLQLASTCLVVLWCRSYRERHENVENPGNNLYVTGLSIRVTEKDLEKYFAKVGEVRLQVKLDKFDWSQWHKSKCPTMWFVRIFGGFQVSQQYKGLCLFTRLNLDWFQVFWTFRLLRLVWWLIPGLGSRVVLALSPWAESKMQIVASGICTGPHLKVESLQWRR
jgi:RNA recognition motif-containing protein